MSKKEDKVKGTTRVKGKKKAKEKTRGKGKRFDFGRAPA
jgi:hypothetical protein